MCAAPVAALAQSTGGTQVGDPSATQPTALPARDAILLGRTMHVRGTLSGAAGQTVVVERREAGGDWQPATTAIAANDDSFDATWTTDHIGHFQLRAHLQSTGDGSTAAAAAALPTSEITVFRGALATWFGPGFYGRRTACGQVMTHRLLGVAHRTLPCGTKVALALQGPHHHRPGRRSRPVRQRRELRPDLGDRRGARDDPDVAHRRRPRRLTV